MVTCPKCKAENRPEAAFCSSCGTILFAQPVPIKIAEQPAETEPVTLPTPFEPSGLTGTLMAIQADMPEMAVPAPVYPVGMQTRSAGSIFGGRFRCDALLSQDEHENHYSVTQVIQPDTPLVRICSNPDCQTIHCPVGSDLEKFCTQCGHPLDEGCLLFVLQESDDDKYSNIKQVLDLHLVHPNIHPPVASFEEEMHGGTQFYLVTPCSVDVPDQPEIPDVLHWGVQLAGALDYLQSKGVILGDEVNSASIGLQDNKAVWRDFSSARTLPMLTDREKINNLRLLTMAMYAMMSGKTEYSMDPYLPPSLNSLFEKALVGEGFTSGAELAKEIEQAKAGGVERLILDYQVGRRSHPGKVRTLNEDSLLSLELSSIQQGTILPCGLFAIADGMGGHASGDLASGMVINTIAKKALCEIVSLQTPAFDRYMDWLKETVQAANLAVYETRKKAGNDMGSTLVLCLLIGTQAYLAHQGDSRIYLVNQGSIQQLTTDHSLVQHMVTTGQISQDEARNHPQRNVIYRSLGDKPTVEVDCLTQQVFPHDRLLLCSDGLTSVLEDDKLQKIVLDANSPQEACDRLIEAANSAGGEDNISVIVIEIIPV